MDITIDEKELGILVAIICVLILAFVWLLLSKRRESKKGQVLQAFEKIQRSDVNESSSESLSDDSDDNIQDDSDDDDEDEEVHHSSVYKSTAYIVEKPIENEPKVRKPVVTVLDQTITEPPLKKAKQIEQLLRTSRCIVRGSPSIYKVPIKITKKVKEGIIEKAEVGTPHPLQSKPIRVFMVVGATGAGKSTLINGMVNYLLGVKFEDDCRFKIITDEISQSQAHSQTQKITAYTIYWHEDSPVNYDLIIIDTPGFGDTRGIKQDQKIKEQIREFFSLQGGIDQIHGVGFVIPSTLPRLTQIQKYIFDSVLSVFGKDIEESIFIMATFSDGDEPVVKNALKVADIPYCQLHKFNNEPLFKTKAKAINKHNWKMAYDNFKNFFNHFTSKNAVSLQLTRDVLEERQKLETLVEGLHTQIKNGIVKIDALNQEEKVLRLHETDILQNKDFTYKVTITKHRKIDITGQGWYVTNCQTCNFTCHRACAFSNDKDKHRCSAMNGRGVADASCRVCPGHCHWKLHRNNAYYFETYEDEETRTSAELKERFHAANTKKSGMEGMISTLEKELGEMYNKVFLDIREVRKSLQRLSEIALKPNPLSDADYISLLIQAEKNEQKPGYIKRIAYLTQVKGQAKFMEKFKDDQVEEIKGAKEWWKEIGAQKIDENQ